MINNDRNEYDFARLYNSSSSGMLQGTDGYPTTDGNSYYIAGGYQDKYFKATAIEFYGVKTHIWL